LSDEKFVKKEGMSQTQISNLLRMASIIKYIKNPFGDVYDLKGNPLANRFEVLMRMPTSILAPLTKTLESVLMEAFDIMQDKITVHCKDISCDGEKEVEISVGNEGFFIK